MGRRELYLLPVTLAKGRSNERYSGETAAARSAGSSAICPGATTRGRCPLPSRSRSTPSNQDCGRRFPRYLADARKGSPHASQRFQERALGLVLTPSTSRRGERAGAHDASRQRQRPTRTSSMGDLIVGRGNRSAIATLVDRRSRCLHLVGLPHGHDAAAVRDALIAAFARLPAAARRCGSGCSRSPGVHLDLGPGQRFGPSRAGRRTSAGRCVLRLPGQPVDARHEREHQRPAAPALSEGQRSLRARVEELRRVQDRLNNRPRKTLGWQTPAEAFDGEVRSSCTATLRRSLEFALELARRKVRFRRR